MNKTDVLEIIQKRTTQIIVLSVVFVGMVMVFLIPSLIEEVQANADERHVDKFEKDIDAFLDDHPTMIMDQGQHI